MSFLLHALAVERGVAVAEPLVAVILAAGEGTRMNSKTPKVLHPVAGRPMLDYALRNAAVLSPTRTYVVVDSLRGRVAAYVGRRAACVAQGGPRGTGHAVGRVLPRLKSFRGHVLVHCADACLVRPQTVLALRQFHLLQKAAATLLAARVEDPSGYSRILRSESGEVSGLVGEAQASGEQRRINEINGGVYLFQAPLLARALGGPEARRLRGEWDLSGAVRRLLEAGGSVQALMVPDRTEVPGVNNRFQLAQAHRLLNLRRVEEHQRNGVTFLDPSTVELDPGVSIGKDAVVEGNVRLLGDTRVGEDCRIGSGSVVDSARLGRGVEVRSSRITGSRLGDGCDAGPFAHVRGGCVLEAGVHVGTNTELKNARIGRGSKVGHFSYVGDAVLGRDVNVGAGCVFANYDGKAKHGCRIGDRAFLGSNSTLVAPVSIGPGAVVGAGAVVTHDVPARAKVAGVPARPLRKAR